MKRIYNRTMALLMGTLLVGAIAKGVSGYMTLLTRDLVDTSLRPGMPGFQDIALRMVVFAFVLFLLETLLSFVKGYYRKKTNVHLKMYYLEKIFQKNINEFNKDSNAKYVSHMMSDLNTVDLDYIDGIFELALSVISFVITIVIIGGVSMELLVIVLVVGGLVGVLSNVLSKPIQKLYAERSGLYDKYTHYLQEVLSAFRIIRVNSLYPRVETQFSGRSEKLQEKSFEIEKKSTYIYAVQNFMINFVVLFVMVISVYYAVLGKITFGGVILILNNFSSLIGPFQRASELLPKIISTKALFKVLDESLINQEVLNETEELQRFQEEISFEGVAFSYGENKVLEDLTLSLKKNGKYLIVGPSGGGKSTFLKLLRKYFHPQTGGIYVDGKPLNQITKESYFRHLSNVEQNVFMFDDTLRNNLTLLKDTKEEKLNEAIRRAGLTSFVENLPQGLETVIEDNGRNISGGERSRIAIARALLNESEILILDEAFQSLDYETARAIERTILDLPELTVVNVSHILIPENKNAYDEMLYVDRKRIERVPIRGV
ncbi:ABC transporter ATP-binding protein [Proteiniclasticum ruminis]|uniref:ABC-type multidrug transport system, ATPase and permease component n=1 Tax=Proteiniclasticum ruminis TaxID=398199 RepID=A0A1G8T4E2_9CLOT|nr:ABC transporter ATP-binding protein [Proteiniclasticum ruminis]SDJ36479.1 ABC-type multidrug transport system, ATPase and permease component [Proteiniclasticum ruminis]